MKLSDQERQQIIAELTANCGCWKGIVEAGVLANLSDERLLALKSGHDKERQAIVVANAAANGHTEGGQQFRVNPDTGRWESRPAPAPAKPKTAPTPPPSEPAPTPAPAVNVDPPPVRRAPQTLDELLRIAPPDVQNKLQYLQGIEQREKDKIIGQLLANVDPADRRAHHERLQRRSLEDLQYDLSLLPKAPPADPEQRPAANQRSASRRAPVDDDRLDLPSMGWEEVGASGKATAGKAAPVRVENADDGFDDVTDEELLSRLPGHLRARVQNAAAWESRQKEQLVNEILANVTDEAKAARLAVRLPTMTLEQLEDFAAALPRRESARVNYFGSAGAPALNASRSAADANEDVLPLPSMDWEEIRRQA